MFENLKKALHRIAGIWQPAYDRIKAWDLPPEVSELFDSLWKSLSPQIQAGLWKLLKEMYEKYGVEKAKEILKVILEYLSKIFNVEDSE